MNPKMLTESEEIYDQWLQTSCTWSQVDVTQLEYFVVLQECNMGGSYWRILYPLDPKLPELKWCCQLHYDDKTDLGESIEHLVTGQRTIIENKPFSIEKLATYVAKCIKISGSQPTALEITSMANYRDEKQMRHKQLADKFLRATKKNKTTLAGGSNTEPSDF